MNKYLVGGLIALILLLAFYLGRRTAPVPDDLHPGVIDSLNLSLQQAIKLQNQYLADSRAAYERGIASQKVKVVSHTIYLKDTASHHSLPKSSKDSLIKTVLKVSQADSSVFTTPVADGILDLADENAMLNRDQDSDSTTIAELFNAYVNQDSAKNVTDRILANREAVISEKDQTIDHLQKQVEKQTFLKWVFLGLGSLVAILL